MPYDNIKSHKKQSFPISSEDTFFEKLQGEDPPPPVPQAVLGLKRVGFSLDCFQKSESDKAAFSTACIL